MTALTPHDDERHDDLMAARALWGLDATEEAELHEHAGTRLEDEAVEWERAVAALQDGLAAGRATPPPPGLEAKLRADAEAYFAQGATAPVPRSAASARPARGPLPWLLAAAALLIAVLGWWPRLAPEPTPGQSLQALLDEAPADLLRLKWIALDDPAAEGADGEIVWSDSRQQGYMRFRGLERNDPTQEQYQLWIFDRDQADAHPIDGGVFDIPREGGEVVVPVDPKIAVDEAWQFAVTVEKPGGVVVSDRSRLPLLVTTES